MNESMDPTDHSAPDRAMSESAAGQTGTTPGRGAGQGGGTPEGASAVARPQGGTSSAGSLARFVLGATLTGWQHFVSQARGWDDASQPKTPDPFTQQPDSAITARHVALGLMVDTSERVGRGGTKAFQSARQVTDRLAGHPARRVARSRLLAPARRRYDALLARGQRQVRRWAVRGQVEETRSRELFRSVVSESVDASIEQIAQNPEIQELVETQSENMAREVIEELRERGVNTDLITSQPFDRLLRRTPRMVEALLPPAQQPATRKPQPPPNLLGNPAGFGSRFVALVTDIVLVSVSFIAILWLVDAVQTVFGAGHLAVRAEDVLTTLHVGALAVPGTTLYAMVYLLFFWTVTGQTPGKALMGLRVVNSRGGKLSFGRALIRVFGYVVSTFFVYLGFLWVLVDRRFRGWHDLLAGSQVVYTWKATPDESFISPWAVVIEPESIEPQSSQPPNQEPTP
jgi:uncharacterized RDD family membrane protein YckC